MAKVLVLYYSSYGHIERLAQAELFELRTHREARPGGGRWRAQCRREGGYQASAGTRAQQGSARLAL
jgi:hypothetical protein